MCPQASCSPLNPTFHIFKIGVLIPTSQMGASSLSLGGLPSPLGLAPQGGPRDQLGCGGPELRPTPSGQAWTPVLALPRIHEASLCCSWGNREEKGLSFPNCGTTRGYTPASQTLNLETYFPR